MPGSSLAPSAPVVINLEVCAGWRCHKTEAAWNSEPPLGKQWPWRVSHTHSRLGCESNQLSLSHWNFGAVFYHSATKLIIIEMDIRLDMLTLTFLKLWTSPRWWESQRDKRGPSTVWCSMQQSQITHWLPRSSEYKALPRLQFYYLLLKGGKGKWAGDREGQESIKIMFPSGSKAETL